MSRSYVDISSTGLVLRKCLNLLSQKDRRKVAFIFFLQIATIMFDIAGVLILGVVLSVATATIRGTYESKSLSFFDQIPYLNSSPQITAAILAVIAASFLIMKSFLTMYFTFRNARFFAIREANLAVDFYQKIFSRPYDEISNFSTAQYQFAANNSIHAILGGLIGQTISLASELVLQLAMFITLLVVSPSLTLITSFVFLGLFLLLNRVQGRKARQWGSEISVATVDATSAISNGIASYREVIISNRLEFLKKSFSHSRNHSAKLNVKRSLLSNISKNIFESAVVLLGMVVAGFSFWQLPAEKAASLVGLFLIAAMRIAPSLLRLQQGLVEIKGSIGSSQLYFEIADTFHNDRLVHTESNIKVEPNNSTNYAVVLKRVSFQYYSSKKTIIDDLSLNLVEGSHNAIVGPSGSGKTTLVDLILGVLRPQHGEVRIFGRTPEYWHKQRESGIAYVPQNVHIFDGSLIENVTFFQERNEVNKPRVLEVLNSVGLDDWTSDGYEGLELQLGDRGSKISGGQKQRIGLARALYQNPKLLILDEATSSLDAEIEFEVTKTIRKLPKSVTTITIAHRLSTVVESDNVIYMDAGKSRCVGSFDYVRDEVPNFDRQANLMGLKR